QMQLLELIPSREYATIVSSLGAGRDPYHEGDISPDGRLLAVGMGEAGDRLWDLASGREIALLPSGSHCVLFQSDGHELLTCFVARSQDGRWVASSGWHSDRVRLWNARTGNMVHEWVLGLTSRAFFTPDSRALIICRGDAFTFWDVETLQPIRRLARDVALFP